MSKGESNHQVQLVSSVIRGLHISGTIKTLRGPLLEVIRALSLRQAKSQKRERNLKNEIDPRH